MGVSQKIVGENNKMSATGYLWVIFGVAIVSIIIVFGLYFYTFDGSFSSEQNKWGVFGDYIGGTLNPLLSFLALLALLITIALQSNQLFLSRKELELTKDELAKTAEAAQRQASYFDREAKRADLYRIIEKLANRINANYNEDRIEPAPSSQIPSSIHAALKKGSDLNANPALRRVYENYQKTTSDTYRTVRWIVTDLERLAHYITAYEEASESKDRATPFPEFYRGEFGAMVIVFHKLSMVEDFLYEFYCG